MLPEMTTIQKVILGEIRKRSIADPVSYQDLAQWLHINPRAIRKEVEDLVMIYKQPILSSYSPKAPGYFWPHAPAEARSVCGTMIRHGAAIIRRARIVGKLSMDEVLGQTRIELEK